MAARPSSGGGSEAGTQRQGGVASPQPCHFHILTAPGALKRGQGAGAVRSAGLNWAGYGQLASMAAFGGSLCRRVKITTLQELCVEKLARHATYMRELGPIPDCLVKEILLKPASLTVMKARYV